MLALDGSYRLIGREVGLSKNTKVMTTTFERLLHEAHQRPLIGWDLSLDGRITFLPPQWDFEALVTEAAALSRDLLDMGTGGGEWLSGLPTRPARTVATEGWPPNVPVARKRLEPFGIEVIEVEGAPANTEQQVGGTSGLLPLLDSSFHLICNRHESYLPSEVMRVLVPGGRFLTQQVASSFNAELLSMLGEPLAPPNLPWNLAFAMNQA
ncbi:MAG: class I SAM-dependent methyltransferase, partial [Pyrinomonadaceae bacterium]